MAIHRIAIQLPPGATLKTTRRKGNTSSAVLLTVNASTEVVVQGAETSATPAPAPLPAGAITIHRKLLTRGGPQVWPEAFAWSAPYARSTGLLLWQPGQLVELPYLRGSLGGTVPMPEHTYTLMLDGQAAASTTVPAGRDRFAFRFTAPAVPGWLTLTVGGLQPGEQDITYFAAVAGSTPTLVPVVQSSLELSHRYRAEDYAHAWAWVPVGHGVARPTPDHAYEPVTDPREQTADMLVAGDSYPPVSLHQSPDGTWTTMGDQPYYWDQVIGLNRPLPSVHLLDGPRGIGTVCFATHIEIGRATQTEDPSSAPRRNAYATDPWRVMRVSNTGEVTTLAGYRHRAGTAEGAPELVGDWSAVPAERRGFDLLWGLCWDSRTLRVDPALPPVEGRPPHIAGPRAYVADSKRHRVCRLQFQAAAHTPAVVSEVFSGPGVWDCVEDAATATMLVSLRDQDRVVRMTFDGAITETVIERDPALPGRSKVDYRHVASRIDCTAAEAAAQPILAPEGLYLLDGLLYIGSRAQGQITVVDLASRRVVSRVPVSTTGNSMFVKLAVSDGSYGPRGTIFYATFDVQYGGRWYGIQPDGAKWLTATNVPYPMDSYQMSFGVGGGRLIAGGSDFGLIRHFKGPRLDMDLYAAGEAEFKSMHGRLAHGPHGVGRFNVPNPSPALAYYLRANYA